MKTLIGALLFAASAALPLHASVVITGTRVIYPASESEVTVKLYNDGKQPALVQAWIDAGDPKTTPTNAKAPFTITPPIARMDPGKSQTLRLSYIGERLPADGETAPMDPDKSRTLRLSHTGERLPADRESVFYLNVLEVPPRPTAQAHTSNNWLQLAIRSRLKLFFRPTALKKSVQDALPQLIWKLDHENGTEALSVRNPSPYYVTLTGVELRGNGPPVSAKVDQMLAPGAQQVLPLQGKPPAGAQVHLRAISELGGILEADRPLAP
jgi:chaperone protein EcpD